MASTFSIITVPMVFSSAVPTPSHSFSAKSMMNISDPTTPAATSNTETEILCAGKMYGLLHAVGSSYGNAHGFVGLSVAAVGVAANAANIGVLSRPHMKSCTNLLLTALAIADLLTVASFLPIYLHFYIWRTPDAEPFDTPYPIAAFYLFFQVHIVTNCKS